MVVFLVEMILKIYSFNTTKKLASYNTKVRYFMEDKQTNILKKMNILREDKQ